MELTVSILNYNTKDQTANCVESVIKEYKEYLKNQVFEVVILDNGSTDNSFDYLSKRFRDEKGITVVKNSENLGFGKGHNKASEYAHGKYLFFLNSDTVIKDQGLLEMLKYLKEGEKEIILGTKLINSDGTIQKSTGNFLNLGTTFLMLVGLERLGLTRFSPKKIQKVDWVMGASMMVKKDIFEKIGGFNKELFMYMEDMEFCYRAKRLGYLTYFYKDIEIIHKEHGSSNRTFAIVNIYNGLLYFYRTYKPYWQFLVVKLLLKVKAGILFMLGLALNNTYLKKTYSHAFCVS